MRLFQNAGLQPAYRSYLNQLAETAKSFEERIAIMLNDRYGGAHMLKPVIDGLPDAFFTNGDDPVGQALWAVQNGLRPDSSLEQILLAQIEHHRTEVFYNGNPVVFDSAFILKLPGCVKKTIGWRAAPFGNADFSAYSAIVCNFPSILQSLKDRGWRAEYFAPGHDPVMDEYASNSDRPIDVLFVGSFTRHHIQRARYLQTIAKLHERFNVVFHLDNSGFSRIAESGFGRLLPLGKYRRPRDVRAVSQGPVYGRALYSAISKAKIVFNGAIDMSGADRGNMRCWEAMGCGALLVSDRGNYPEGMKCGETMFCYDSTDPLSVIEEALSSPERSNAIRTAGRAEIRARYSKEMQWDAFCKILTRL